LVKKELIVLITPYIIDDDRVAEQVTEAFRDQLGPWAQTAPGEAPKAKAMKQRVELPVKPEASPVAPPVAPPVTPPMPAAATDETAQPEAAAPQSSAPAAATPVAAPKPGPKVSDPALLEELRKAATGK
jgi:general secretion pathway protein D